MAETRCSRRKIVGFACVFLLVATTVLYSKQADGPYESPYAEERPLLPGVRDEAHEDPWWDGGECSRTNFSVDQVISVGGTCGRRAWTAGDGQKVVGLSLYGDKEEYWQGLGDVLTKVRLMYPGWKVRLYTDTRGRKDALCSLLLTYDHFYVCNVEDLPLPLGDVSKVHPMLWRTLPLGDPQVAAMIVRDTDSPISKREAAAVEEWLLSNKTFHIMRDHPAHDTTILGGMWGARWDHMPAPQAAKELAELRDKMLERGYKRSRHGVDQEILSRVLWPVAQGRMVGHDSYLCEKYPYSVPWPTQRENGFFVGAPTFRSQFSHATLNKSCPEACRPKEHKDWIYC